MSHSSEHLQMPCRERHEQQQPSMGVINKIVGLGYAVSYPVSAANRLRRFSGPSGSPGSILAVTAKTLLPAGRNVAHIFSSRVEGGGPRTPSAQPPTARVDSAVPPRRCYWPVMDQPCCGVGV